MFHVRCIFPEQGRIEANSFELKPTNSQGEAVCDLFHRFLADRPPEFRDRLPFLSRGDIELDWSAAAGGVALASLFCSGGPAAISVLLSGIDEQADAMMSEVFRENVLEVLFSGQFEEALGASGSAAGDSGSLSNRSRVDAGYPTAFGRSGVGLFSEFAGRSVSDGIENYGVVK